MKRTRLRPVSPKRALLNREYEKAKRLWYGQHDGRCEMRFMNDPEITVTLPIRGGKGVCRIRPARINLPHQPPSMDDPFRCRSRADKGPHHSKKRGPYLCDISTFMGMCRECHVWIHSHENLSRELGYLIRP